jgi:hypothetical protein
MTKQMDMVRIGQVAVVGNGTRTVIFHMENKPKKVATSPNVRFVAQRDRHRPTTLVNCASPGSTRDRCGTSHISSNATPTARLHDSITDFC